MEPMRLEETIFNRPACQSKGLGSHKIQLADWPVPCVSFDLVDI